MSRRTSAPAATGNSAWAMGDEGIMMWKGIASAAAAMFAFAPIAAEAGRDLDQIKQRGTLRCGVQGPSNPGFGVPDSHGRWTGFNVEICRAIAITIFGDPAKVEFVP